MGKTKKDSVRYSKEDAAKKTKKVYKKPKYSEIDPFYNDEESFDDDFEPLGEECLVDDLSDEDYSDGILLDEDFLDDEYSN